ncbi:MAG: phosphatidylcholine and lysophosphatidylcholine phospholipase [Thelocarpon superellum]|nr:MAG: phosphatidylcholine and lysophosphatidylcholine phospholipase [Thelocarpon superellum]
MSASDLSSVLGGVIHPTSLSSTVAASAVTSLPSVLSTVETMIIPPNGPPTSAPVRIGRHLFTVLKVIPSLLVWLITFLSLTLPTWLFTLFSTSLTFTMNFTTLLLIALAIASSISWLIRYRYLNMYARLPLEPPRTQPEIELFPDTQEGDSKPGLANYLDEFLSAIKVFGYLERPVFHELTRTMQTRKMIAGETLLLEEEKGFCLVVDGLVQIFVKSSRDGRTSPSNAAASEQGRWSYVEEDEEEDEPQNQGSQGYQLLTEVKNGAPMSSLFSILSLFTEDVQLRHSDEEDPGNDLASSGKLTPGREPRSAGLMGGSTPSSPTAGPGSPHASGIARDNRPSALTMTAGDRLPSIPPFSLDPPPDPRHPGARPTHGAPGRQRPRGTLHRSMSVHPDILARATVDTTIAIIPATAFRRLTRVYPRATAHIVQVILTRLQRVTLATAHSYLGLTDEVLRTEKDMNRYTTYDLPNFLRGSALDRLKEKFRAERDRIASEEGMKGIALHNPGARRHRRPSSGLRRDAVNGGQANTPSPHDASATPNGSARSVSYSGRANELNGGGVHPGDLLTNIQMSRTGGRRGRPSIPSDSTPQPCQNGSAEGRPETQSPLGKRSFQPFVAPTLPAGTLHRPESLSDDRIFRESILECIFKAIGLTNTKITPRRVESVEQSPRLVSYDSRRQKAVFSNAFGFIDPYDGSADGDSESQASASLSALSLQSPGGDALANELQDDVEIVFFPQGAVLVEQGERNPGLYYVIDGFLDVSIPLDDEAASTDMFASMQSSGPSMDHLVSGARGGPAGARRHGTTKRRGPASRRSLFLIKPGGVAGYVGTISSYRSFIDVRAKTDVYVGFLPRSSLERIVDRYPVVLLTMAKRLTSLLPRLILHIDFALEWVQVNAGQVIYHQNDESDAIYIVLNGRLRSVREQDTGKMRVVGEYGQGESVGELEVMTESTRPATLHAIRDTELAKFPKSLFNSLALEHPGITIKISKIIASRMRALIEDPLSESGASSRVATAATSANVTTTVNLRTVAILPVTAGVPVVEFGSRLLSALTQIGTLNGVTSLNQAAILNHLGRHAFSRMGRLKLSQYLADLEEKYGMVLYVADTNVNSPWTQTCISQADCILLVALAEGSPQIGEFERFLLGMKTTARKELNRVWINGGHHHIQMAFRTSSEPIHPQIKRFGSALKQRVQVLQAEIQKYTSRRVRQTPVYSSESPFKGDFHRLARRICGKSVGLVLGGGGARGISHVGIIRALEEAGVPIDIVGGTSIGAFIGALYARDGDLVPMYGRAKKFSARMGSMWRFALDLTYPAVSYTTGHEFNRGIFKTLGDSQMEDFWLEFYCNTTNISKSRSEIHTSGYAWRYVRASMSLAGLLPPLCDEGNMLLDGGYVDNLTVAHMKSLGADVIFAVDVGSVDDDSAQQFGDTLSGFWASLNRWNPFSTHPNPPTLSEIQSRLTYVSSVDALERAKTTPGCFYMRPPIDQYGTLEFSSFDEIYDVGYQYGKKFLTQMREKGVLPLVEETEEKKKVRRTMAPRRASI